MQHKFKKKMIFAKTIKANLQISNSYQAGPVEALLLPFTF